MNDKATEDNASAAQSLDEAGNVRYLSAGEFVLFKNPGGGLRLTLEGDRSYLRVMAKLCFPFSFPNKYISLRDDDDEIGIVLDLAQLSKEYRRWIEEDLEIRYFTPQVRAIKSIKHRYGGIEWQVDTDRGFKRLITKGVHDTMTEVEPGRYIITDVDDNRYEICARQLDQDSRCKLEQLV